MNEMLLKFYYDTSREIGLLLLLNIVIIVIIIVYCLLTPPYSTQTNQGSRGIKVGDQY